MVYKVNNPNAPRIYSLCEQQEYDQWQYWRCVVQGIISIPDSLSQNNNNLFITVTRFCIYRRMGDH